MSFTFLNIFRCLGVYRPLIQLGRLSTITSSRSFSDFKHSKNIRVLNDWLKYIIPQHYQDLLVVQKKKFRKKYTCFLMGFKLLDILSNKSNQALSLTTLVSITLTIFLQYWSCLRRPKSLSSPDKPKVPTAFSIRGKNLVKLATSAKMKIEIMIRESILRKKFNRTFSG